MMTTPTMVPTAKTRATARCCEVRMVRTIIAVLLAHGVTGQHHFPIADELVRREVADLAACAAVAIKECIVLVQVELGSARHTPIDVDRVSCLGWLSGALSCLRQCHELLTEESDRQRPSNDCFCGANIVAS